MPGKRKTFEEWLKEVDNHIKAQVFLTHMDLPDIDYRSMYDERVSPKSAAKRAIKNAMDY